MCHRKKRRCQTKVVSKKNCCTVEYFQVLIVELWQSFIRLETIAHHVGCMSVQEKLHISSENTPSQSQVPVMSADIFFSGAYLVGLILFLDRITTRAGITGYVIFHHEPCVPLSFYLLLHKEKYTHISVSVAALCSCIYFFLLWP